MKLTRAECIYLLEKAGMKVEEENVSLNAYRDRILYNGERVGTVYYDSVALSTHYISIEVKPMTIKYKDEDAVDRLEKAIDLIVNYDFESEKRMESQDSAQVLRRQSDREEVERIPMKRETLKKLLEWHGFDLDDVDMIWYKSDRVGDVAGALVTLADYIPSMIDADYRSVNKTTININGKDTVQRLETLINRLYDTPRRWEDHLRESRLDRVRKYFKDRKDAETALSQPTYDYEKLLNQLVIQRK